MHYLVAFVHSPMIQRARQIAMNVRHQRAAKRHIDHLMTPANRQQGFALPEHFINHDQLAQIPFPAIGRDIHRAPNARRQTVGVKAGIDIIAAGQKHAVTTSNGLGEQFSGPRRRQRYGNCTGAHERFLIIPGQADREVPKFLSLRLNVGRN